MLSRTHNGPPPPDCAAMTAIGHGSISIIFSYSAYRHVNAASRVMHGMRSDPDAAGIALLSAQ